MTRRPAPSTANRASLKGDQAGALVKPFVDDAVFVESPGAGHFLAEGVREFVCGAVTAVTA
ncbi:hypothetical protein [Actinacidiphila sp. bgisy167]|uniref:hypothetical protein n=1 Tax=Actinacidiphila sp. bgisy167 TaxID=3413797 RepID=UPI003D70E466